MATFKLVIDRFSQVVKEGRPFGDNRIESELGRQHRGDESHLERVLERVLVKGQTEVKLSEQFNDIGVGGSQFKAMQGLFPEGFDVQLNLRARFLNRGLDRGRVNPAVLEKLLESELGNLSFNRIKGGNEDGVGGFVDHQGGPRDSFETADIATFPADNASFHVFARQIHNGRSCLRAWRRGDALHRR
ncbi:MAG: hypothetical protein BWY82_00076 [Verrucomicrobia bacterium ADurb.Bin474]|nr:MAG: hypothetical protein BWY82_00076 [Verrucomicrobia bacterium ADurb.Bin474]